MESFHGNRIRSYPELTVRNDHEDQLLSFSEQNSTSSSPSSEDFIQLHASDLRISNAKLNSEFDNQGNNMSSQLNDEHAFSSNVQTENVASSGATENFGLRRMENSSPPLRKIDIYDPPDPNRIPSSIFERSTTPMEWSVASNESLFSIHMGNSSFSRDHIFLMSKEELESYPHNPNDAFPPPPSATTNDFVTSNSGIPSSTEAANAQAMKDILKAASEEHEVRQMQSVEEAQLSFNNCRNSNSSGTSIQSFAFPVLAGEARMKSMKVESQKPRQQQQKKEEQQHIQPKEETKKHQTKKWFTCFSCGSLCR